MSFDGASAFSLIEKAISIALGEAGKATLVVGLCGAQGSGKSTVAAALHDQFVKQGRRVALLSLDDLYLSHAARQSLARTVHPLLATRGVPGTHDVDHGIAILEGLRKSGKTVLPRFDKAHDDPAPRDMWAVLEGPVDLILFEGWCIGARPEEEAALVAPINALERDEDPDGRWRRYVNQTLGDAYRRLFAHLDMLVLLAAPSFSIVHDWRNQQERALEADLARQGREPTQLMTEDQLSRFIQHYERLTRHILEEMPGRADLVIQLGQSRAVTYLVSRGRYRPQEDYGKPFTSMRREVSVDL